METWHWGLVAAGLILFFGIVGYLCYRCRRGHSQQKQQQQRHIDYHQDPPAIIIDGDDKNPPPYHVVEANPNNSSSQLHDSRSTTPHTLFHPGIITPLSAPPAQFFHDRTQSRWMPVITKSPSPSSFQNDSTANTDGTDNYRRFLSLSPFLGHTHSSSPSPSPVSTCSGQTRTPSPVLAKLASSWSTWKKHT